MAMGVFNMLTHWDEFAGVDDANRLQIIHQTGDKVVDDGDGNLVINTAVTTAESQSGQVSTQPVIDLLASLVDAVQ